MHRDVMPQFFEKLIAGDKVRFAVQFYHRADSTTGVDVSHHRSLVDGALASLLYFVDGICFQGFERFFKITLVLQ